MSFWAVQWFSRIQLPLSKLHILISKPHSSCRISSVKNCYRNKVPLDSGLCYILKKPIATDTKADSFHSLWHNGTAHPENSQLAFPSLCWNWMQCYFSGFGAIRWTSSKKKLHIQFLTHKVHNCVSCT